MKEQDKKEPVATLGQHLRKERDLRGIDLDEVSRVTRVRLAYLQYLEDDRLSDLPGDVYTRGYIRAYARFLGIDGDHLIELCRNQSPARGLAPVATFDGRFGMGLDGKADGPLPVLNEGRSEPAATATSTGGMPVGSARPRRSRIGLALVIVMLFCAALLITGVYYVNRAGDQSPDSNKKTPAAQNDKNAGFFPDS